MGSSKRFLENSDNNKQKLCSWSGMIESGNTKLQHFYIALGYSWITYSTPVEFMDGIFHLGASLCVSIYTVYSYIQVGLKPTCPDNTFYMQVAMVNPGDLWIQLWLLEASATTPCKKWLLSWNTSICHKLYFNKRFTLGEKKSIYSAFTCSHSSA